MSHGEHLTERMVDVAHGRSGWTDPEAAHLRVCAECAAEWRLTARATDVGSVEVDAARLADAVVARLAAPQARQPSPWSRWVVGLAAAAAIVIFALQAGPGKPTALAPLAPTTVLSELDDLTHEELLTVLDALDPLPDDATVPEAVPLGDLTPGELERVLRSMEG